MREATKSAIEDVKKGMSVRAAARSNGIGRTTLREQMAKIERLPDDLARWTYPKHIKYELRDATVLVGGDAHFWPGEKSLAWEAFVEVAHAIKPHMIIMNGDILDGARVSRHPRLRGQNAPSIGQEINEALKQLARLPKSEYIWTYGNHDARIDKYLMDNAPELSDFAGDIRDRFDKWAFSYAVTINDLPCVIPTEIRHYFRQGIHARHNNVLNAGIHLVTNHTHQLGVTPFNNLTGRIYGVETGTLADPNGPQFEYGQGMPTRCNPGFGLLSFDGAGNLLPPELCEVIHGKALFRGGSWGTGEKPRFRVMAR